MLLIFAMMGVLLWSSFNRTFTGILFGPSWWPLEVSQFLMVAYFLLGGAYSMQLGDNVRMDLLYGVWSDRTKAAVDAVTIRSEEHTSELQSLMRISYAVFCLEKKKNNKKKYRYKQNIQLTRKK